MNNKLLWTIPLMLLSLSPTMAEDLTADERAAVEAEGIRAGRKARELKAADLERWPRRRGSGSKVGMTSYGKPLHSLRGSCITEWAEAKIPAHVVQVYAGHADIETTMRYYTRVDKESRRYGKASTRDANSDANMRFWEDEEVG